MLIHSRFNLHALICCHRSLFPSRSHQTAASEVAYGLPFVRLIHSSALISHCVNIGVRCLISFPRRPRQASYSLFCAPSLHLSLSPAPNRVGGSFRCDEAYFFSFSSSLSLNVRGVVLHQQCPGRRYRSYVLQEVCGAADVRLYSHFIRCRVQRRRQQYTLSVLL